MTKDGFGNLSTFKGQRVIQKDGKPGMNVGGKFVKIWFPDGPPVYNKDTALPIEAYDQKTLEMWKAFEATGEFKDKVIPDLPPPREATTWDF
jgi:nucleoporin NUP42